MIEVDTTDSCQMPNGINAKVLCASVSVSSTQNIHANQTARSVCRSTAKHVRITGQGSSHLFQRFPATSLLRQAAPDAPPPKI